MESKTTQEGTALKVRAIDFVVSGVSDLERAKTFYRDVLGIEDPILFEDPEWVEFDTKPVALALMHSGSKPSTMVALAVADVRAAVEELRQKGVTIVREPFDTPVCVMALIADPDGNPIVLHQRRDGTAG